LRHVPHSGIAAAVPLPRSNERPFFVFFQRLFIRFILVPWYQLTFHRPPAVGCTQKETWARGAHAGGAPRRSSSSAHIPSAEMGSPAATISLELAGGGGGSAAAATERVGTLAGQEALTRCNSGAAGSSGWHTRWSPVVASRPRARALPGSTSSVPSPSYGALSPASRCCAQSTAPCCADSMLALEVRVDTYASCVLFALRPASRLRPPGTRGETKRRQETNAGADVYCSCV